MTTLQTPNSKSLQFSAPYNAACLRTCSRRGVLHAPSNNWNHSEEWGTKFIQKFHRDQAAQSAILWNTTEMQLCNQRHRWQQEEERVDTKTNFLYFEGKPLIVTLIMNQFLLLCVLSTGIKFLLSSLSVWIKWIWIIEPSLCTSSIGGSNSIPFRSHLTTAWLSPMSCTCQHPWRALLQGWRFTARADQQNELSFFSWNVDSVTIATPQSISQVPW